MSFRFPAVLLIAVSLLWLGCTTKNSSSTSSGTGALFVATLGDSKVSAFTIDLSSGKLSANGNGIATGTSPSAMLFVPSANALFVANGGSNDISSYTVGSDGRLAAGSQTQCTLAPTGNAVDPVSLSTDSGGKLLFVAYLGAQFDSSQPSAVCVFSIQNATLTQKSITTFAVPSPGPSAVAVTPNGKFLYVANQFDATVAEYSVDQNSGALTPVGVPYTVRTTPSALAIVLFPDSTNPTGEFLYVANTGSNNVSAFAICDQATSSCNSSNLNSPNGALTEVFPGSPFSTGTRPVSIAASASGKFLYVADQGSFQVSEFKISTGTGALTDNTSATISTGTSPAWIATRAGTSIVSATKGATDFAYVANSGSSTVSVYSFDSTVGVLNVVGAPVSTSGQPSAVAAK